MSNVPDAETRARSVNNLRELVKRMDQHIADLDALNAQLDLENQKSLFADYLRRREQRLASLEIAHW